MRNNLLFKVRPNEIFEHPPELSEINSEIPVGKLEGWRVVGYNYSNRETVVIEEPEILEVYDDKCRCIQIGDTQYWYSVHREFGPKSPMWYQSGCTLRFVKMKQKN